MRPAEIRTPPRDWLQVLRIAYPFLADHGIGDPLLFGSQALSVYMTNPLRSKDLDLVSSQVGPRHLEALRAHLQARGLETKSTTIQSKPLAHAPMTVYTIELRLNKRPFFLEIFDKILDGQNPSILTPHTQRVRKWDLNLWTPSRECVVALRLSFRQPEGISRLNAVRLNTFIKKNSRKLDFEEIRKILQEWKMERLVEQNLTVLHKVHRLHILHENKLGLNAKPHPATNAIFDLAGKSRMTRKEAYGLLDKMREES